MAISTVQQSAYLQRLGFDTPPEPTEVTLGRLHRAHLQNIPFENLDIHLDTPIVLTADRLLDKITIRGRGGFCYELNGAFASLLRSLGFDVTLMEGRVFSNGAIGIRFDHLCLSVVLDQPYLVDVGFGDCFNEPLVLDSGMEQVDGGDRFLIEAHEDEWLDLHRNGEPQYRFLPTPRSLEDFNDGCYFHQTSSDSPFTRNTVCSRLTGEGRVTLRGLTLIETVQGERRKSQVSPSDLAGVLASRFGVHVSDAEAAILQLTS